ncbi:MAG TPA: type II toxin-antitoxin system VapC family toxin [Solirubrobacteraceae bacterium]|nr:type II toxin-antitoxin system VapC family toxin [Solirubrobacteraceae bacterium]
MRTVYLDTSVLGRVLLDEPDTPAIRRELSRFERHISSGLLSVELHRLGLRENMLAFVSELLSGKVLIPVDAEILAAAETIAPPTVATLDAIHLATAVSLSRTGKLDALMTYDKQLATGAREHGLEVLAPS